MKSIRTALASLAIVLLISGWLGSTAASFAGTPTDWATKVDGPGAGGIRLAALALLLAAVVLALIPAEPEP